MNNYFLEHMDLSCRCLYQCFMYGESASPGGYTFSLYHTGFIGISPCRTTYIKEGEVTWQGHGRVKVTEGQGGLI